MILKISIRNLNPILHKSLLKFKIQRKIFKVYKICLKRANQTLKLCLDLNKVLLKYHKINLYQIYKMQHLYQGKQLKRKMMKLKRKVMQK